MTRLTDYITENEGYRQFPYKDTEGILTIGIGFNLDEVGLSLEESKVILKMRTEKLIEELKRSVPVYKQVDSIRKVVLVDMAFNLGIPRLLGFKRMLAAMESRDYERAAKELLDSRYARQVKGRARRNAYMMETGEWFE